MSKQQRKATFKSYKPDQLSLLPPSQDELIEDNHAVRVIREVIDSIHDGRNMVLLCSFILRLRCCYAQNDKNIN